jgi:RNA polymerase sigma-70 factor (ECF subfamily)
MDALRASLTLVMTHYETISKQVRVCAQRIAESGAAGLAGLYDLTANRLVRFATTITRNQHDAEDAVQTTLVRVVANVKFLLAAEAPWPYLLMMVRNESLVILRKKRRWSVALGIADLVTRRSVDELEQEDSFRAVWLAIRTLPVEQREVVVLKIWEELTFAQIGEILGISGATAASRYRYALSKLAKQLGALDTRVHHE